MEYYGETLVVFHSAEVVINEKVYEHIQFHIDLM